MAYFKNYLEEKDPLLAESTQHGRYSIEVNYRSEFDEVADSFAKLCLGYASAGLKNCGYHCKTVFSAKPFRLLVSSRDWDDGEWVGILTFNNKEKHFMIGEGSYNKDKKTVSTHKIRKCDANSAGELVKEMRNLMERLKKTAPVRSGSLEAVRMKTGPKPVSLKTLKKRNGKI